MSKEKTLKAFLISFKMANEFNDESAPIHSVVVVSYNINEASQTFDAHCLNKHKEVVVLTIQKLRKNKKNAQCFTNEYYERQQTFVYQYQSDTIRYNKERK